MRRGRQKSARALALGSALLLLLWAAHPPEPHTVHHQRAFPGLHPAALAHHLADFSNYALLYPHIESWAIESEWSNYTSWRYEVSYRCGAHCTGRAAVSTHAAAAHGSPPQHGVSSRHRVTTRDTHCTSLLPPLPWPELCEETETDTLILAEGAGARLAEEMRAQCSLAATLRWRCVDEPVLRARTTLRLRALEAVLAPEH